MLYPFRMVSASAMVVSLVLGFVAAVDATSPAPSLDDPQLRDRPRRRHPGLHTGVRPGGRRCTDRSEALLQGAAWMVNLAVAEWAIRRKPHRRTPAVPPQVAVP